MDDVAALEQFFATAKLPDVPVKLNKGTTIINTKMFIENHLSIIKEKNGNEKFLPYLERLKEFKNYLEKHCKQ